MPKKSQKREATVAPEPPPRRPRPRMEYRARSDEAWYGARVAVQEGLLHVMFETFLEDADECQRTHMHAFVIIGADQICMQVEKAAHAPVDGVERCACRFTVRWAEGPRRGCREKVGVDVVCCVPESPIQDPALSEFLDDVTKRSDGRPLSGLRWSTEQGC
ncbi:hypothetical protein D1007_39881 [Hordeum vulgare]|nr:hypothetical protein D1007_39881 [Hordeum vulgare]